MRFRKTASTHIMTSSRSQREWISSQCYLWGVKVECCAYKGGKIFRGHAAPPQCTYVSSVERGENTHAHVETILKKPNQAKLEFFTANPRKANLICFNTDHIISIHCSQLPLSDSISSSLKMNRKLKFQRSAVRINQWRQINVHWNFMNFEPIQMKKT